MRIIAGTARSRAILTPQGLDTRPTLDRVRESLFNILQPITPGARVLDLFSGSGALALEALSRGAQSAVMVDISREANRVQIQNVKALGFEKSAAVLLTDWRQALEQLAKQGASFDLIFLDPPYKLLDLRQVGAALLERELLAPDALIVIEHDRETKPVFDPRFVQTDQRQYGKAGILFYQCGEGAGEGHADG